MATQSLTIEGMSCSHCVRAVRQALESVEGVTIESVDVGSARLDVPAGSNLTGDISAAIENAGFHVTAVQS